MSNPNTNTNTNSNSESYVKPKHVFGRLVRSSRISCVERCLLFSFTDGSRAEQLLGRGLPHAINRAIEVVTWRKPLILLSDV
ncbi:hypothetical protein [Paenibacillus amylolyticus]|uniref:hypothetical protein n=1 Tax=Paenibacillus amylolyticus TaxID=1451 RepID=UPI003D9703CB